ncbi:hypothetical protein TELCIR_06381, partial [Teladorsagia circumcincta]
PSFDYSPFTEQECWLANKELEIRLSVMVTKMLRWTAGVTRLDHIRNDTIRFDVAPIADKFDINLKRTHIPRMTFLNYWP